MRLSGEFDVAIENLGGRLYDTYHANYPGHHLELLQDVNDLEDYDYFLYNLLVERTNLELAESILSFTNTMCYNKVLMTLYDRGYVSKCHDLYDKPIRLPSLINLLSRYTRIPLTLINGPSALIIRPIGRIQLNRSIALLIENENITIPSYSFTTHETTPSFLVHGYCVEELSKSISYFKSLEILLNHFGHDGKMKTEYIPSKSNLNRTNYEVLMILLKEESKKYLIKPIYWRVDPIRKFRVDRIREEVLTPMLKKVVVSEKVRFPAIHPSQFDKYKEAIIEVDDDSAIQEKMAMNESIERQNMTRQDVDVGNQELFDRKFSTVVLDAKKSENWRKNLRKSFRKTYTAGPIKTDLPVVHNIDYGEFARSPRRTYALPPMKKKKEVANIRNPDYIGADAFKLTGMDKWQREANLKMQTVLKSSEVLTRSIRNHEATGTHLAKYFSNQKPKQKIQNFRSQMVKGNPMYIDERKKMDFRTRTLKLSNSSALAAREGEKLKGLIGVPQDNKTLLISENVTLRVLYHFLRLSGMPKAAVTLDHENMRYGICRLLYRRHFTTISKNKFTPKGRKFLDQLFKLSGFNTFHVRSNVNDSIHSS